MLVDFNLLQERTVPGMNGGSGEIAARMFAAGGLRLISSRILPGGSIGPHRHENGDDISFVVSGSGTAVCDGTEERLEPGCCHVCGKGCVHSISNPGTEDLVLLTAVVER